MIVFKFIALVLGITIGAMVALTLIVAMGGTAAVGGLVIIGILYLVIRKWIKKIIEYNKGK